MNGNDNSRVDWWAQVVHRGHRRDRGLYVVSMMHLREYGLSRTCSGTGCNYLCHRIRKSSPSLADGRTKKSAKLAAWSWILSHRASGEIYFTRSKFVAEKMTRARIHSRRLALCRVFVIYRKFGETSQKYTRESPSGNAAVCTIYSTVLLSLALRWSYLCSLNTSKSIIPGYSQSLFLAPVFRKRFKIMKHREICSRSFRGAILSRGWERGGVE